MVTTCLEETVRHETAPTTDRATVDTVAPAGAARRAGGAPAAAGVSTATNTVPGSGSCTHGWSASSNRPCCSPSATASRTGTTSPMRSRRSLPDERVDLGNLYRLLRSLEEEDVVTSRWRDDLPGRAKRTYELTDNGRALLDTWAESLGRAEHTIHAFLERFGRDPAPSTPKDPRSASQR